MRWRENRSLAGARGVEHGFELAAGRRAARFARRRGAREGLEEEEEEEEQN